MSIYADHAATTAMSEAAIAAMEEYSAQAKKLREEYEHHFGPITAVPGKTDNGCWISDPWPWNYGFYEGPCH